MTHSDNSVAYFARTNFRNKGIPFGIKQADRFSHMYVIGKTGTGKSTLLETLAVQDFLGGRGMMLIDPHGDLAERVAQAIPAHRRQDLIYFNVPDPTQPFGYNPLKHVREDRSERAICHETLGSESSHDSPLEGRVGADSGRVMDDSGTVKRCFPLEFRRKLSSLLWQPAPHSGN
jgi:type IV secretory pathway VirB4 component